MAEAYFQDLKFDSEEFSEEKFPKGEYDNCIFRTCDFSEADLSNRRFTACVFEDCDLSNARLIETGFTEVSFRNCKMLGLAFEQCSNFLLSFAFTECNVSFSSFFKLKLKNLLMNSCRLQQVDFSDADLSLSKLLNCDLSGAVFYNTRLEKADLSSSHGFDIDPETNVITGAKFSLQNVAGLLTKYKIEIT